MDGLVKTGLVNLSIPKYLVNNSDTRLLSVRKRERVNHQSQSKWTILFPTFNSLQKMTYNLALNIQFQLNLFTQT